MDIFCGINGTGPYDDRVYDVDFNNSFIRCIHDKWKWDAKYYDRGPGMDGYSTRSRAEELYTALMRLYAKVGTSRKDTRLFLAGYSRGGAAVLHVCAMLDKVNIPVDCLLLFDAVKMTAGIEADVIPANVMTSYHAMRDPKSESRSWWGNCGTIDSDGTKHLRQTFFCTHGGMGGMPWRPKNPRDAEQYVNENFIDDPSLVARAYGSVSDAFLITRTINQIHRSASATKVTFRQDAAGSVEVGVWMFARLAMKYWERRPKII